MNEEKQKQDNDQEEELKLPVEEDYEYIDYDEFIEELSHTTFSEIYDI